MLSDDPLADWDFELPDDRIARFPPADRGASRLLVVPPAGPFVDTTFDRLGDWLGPGDLLVANDTRVVKARLFTRRATGGRVEVLLLGLGPGPIEALLRPARRLDPGEKLVIEGYDGPEVTFLGARGDGIFEVALDDALAVTERFGVVPLPPYLGRDAVPADEDRYQTVYAGPAGSSAAPTAGLHFTPAGMAALAAEGVAWATVTLHVGVGTFRPVGEAELASGRLHREPFQVPAATRDAIAAARRVFAVGTTSVRTLEAATEAGARVPTAGAGDTELFIRPGYAFRCVDGFLTNFHLPRSSLLMLVAAKVGRERLFEAYAHALRGGYRFFSYGDAMLVLP